MRDGDARAADWLSVAEATARILDHVSVLEREDIELGEAPGRTLARDVIAPRDLPPWNNSAMDGYAVRSPDVRGASADTPRVLKLTETVSAGAFPTRTVGPGEAIRIMTGAPVPEGADGVVRIEHTRALDARRIAVQSDTDAGRNIRLRGEDMRRGEVVVAAGTLLRAAEIGVLAAVGQASVPVVRRPIVALLATGDELVDLDGFADVLAGKRIVNSNSWALAASTRSAGGTTRDLGIARDDVGDIRRLLQPARDADALVTTAGASVGDHDVVKDALEGMGARTLFWRVRIRPGSPFSFGLLERVGRPALPIFGLPGNPVSAIVTFEILVKPALRRMLGRRNVHPGTIPVRVGERIESKGGLVRFLRVQLRREADGMWWVVPTGEQGSGILTSVARADALLIVPMDVDSVEVGSQLRAVPLWDGDPAQAEPGF